MLNFIDSLLDKKFKEKNTDEPNYPYIQQEYIKEKEKNKNLKDLIMNLSYSMRTPNDDTLTWTKRLKEILNQGSTVPKDNETGTITGGAAGISCVDPEFAELRNFIMEGLNVRVPNPLVYSYYIKINKKLEKEVGDFLRKKTGSPQLYSNDIRHQYVSGIYARNLGINQAKWLGNLNEWTEFLRGDSSGSLDSKIDQINNEIGREYALLYPTISREKFLQILFDDWERNEEYRNRVLKYIK